VRLIIAGSRSHRMTSDDFAALDKLHAEHRFTLVLHGGAKGIDRDGDLWALARSIPRKRMAAEWERYGRAAGPLRNERMAQEADALAVFDGGVGTLDMLTKAKARGLRVFDLRRFAIEGES